MAAAVQRKAIEDKLQRFTLRVTRRTVPTIFSMMLVQGQRASQFRRKTEPAHCEDFIQSLEEAFLRR
jgi:hypothetical protein